ncbi:MAG: phosphonopyruvate decarboxylase, partial [Lachnospiraceae bacterium]|nr:phosphonopyruvate decarboxylase [Lachnospiraceae bacterium]
MLNQQHVFEILQDLGVDFYTGVPDSYLNGFCNYALDHFPERNIIAANEGNAIGIAAGHYFATKQVPLVYMQNSGMGNTVNPLASLADENVYAVPMLLLIGWRGQGNTEPKHPQHKLQGEITPTLLDLLHIPYTILEDDDKTIGEVLKHAVETAAKERKPYGLIAPKGVMAGEKG